MGRGSESALTLVSAPAGFGKTTLLTEWLAAATADDGSIAWLSLDARDNEPVLFWTYLISALATAAPGVGASALALLQTTNPPIDAALATLLNDLQSVSNEVVLVLDDYHAIDSREVHESVAFLLEHLPRHIHVVIASRTDPALPLARLRGRGELVEIRAADLRFTPQEAAAYLNGSMGLALTAEDVETLEGRTEGWIAALQLAALSMQGRDDIAGFIAGFAGDDRYIVDYLAEEVLQRQPEHVRQFLLQTSILDRLSGPLCDAVTGQVGGKVTLTTLERGNLFLVPLDDRRQWYRYHHLFADVLQAHLLDEQPDGIPELHRRASAWYELEGEPYEAIEHAFAAQDVERAADLLERAFPALKRNRQEVMARGWLDMLPDELVRNRPVLGVNFLGVLLSMGEVEGVEALLANAERWMDAALGAAGDPDGPSGGMVVVDHEEFRRLPGAIAVYRAAFALALGDVPATEVYARRALEISLADDNLGRAAAAGILAIADWTIGDLEAAHTEWTACTEGLLRAGHVADTFGCALGLADIWLVQGRLGEAMRTYEQALQRAPEPNVSILRGTADMHVGMSAIHCERNDLDSAAADLQRSQELGEHTGLSQNPYRWRVAMARVREAQGDAAAALSLLDEAERLYTTDLFPHVRPVPAMRARVLAAQGEWGQALAWAREQELSVEDDLTYLREFEHITLARVLVAQYAATRDERPLADASALLERLLLAAVEGKRTGSVLEILVLQSLAHQAQGDTPTALERLQRAVILAEPEGYVRLFVDEGAPMVALLRAVAKSGIAPVYIRRLLAAANQHAGGAATVQGLIERLSDRELDVLRLLGSDLDGPAIARELVVSLNTVRTHTKNIYAKLGVNNRRAAVRAATELNLLARTRDH